MKAPTHYKLLSQNLWLSAHRALFWEEEKALILSDLHLGKSGHFRKAGIPIPQTVLQEDMQRLVELLHYFKPAVVIVVGDFFHSTANLELDFFKRWREDLAHQRIILVKGNHDILSAKWYESAGIEVIEDHLCMGDFCFSHDGTEVPEGLYSFTGHIHPGIQIHGLAKQSLRLPCFYFGKTQAILPAFGKFTGLANIAPAKGDKVFAIAEGSLIAVH
jgi:uncharacterized protein